MAGWTIAVASALLVVSVFDAMGRLRSVDMREQLAEALDSASARRLGISVDQATDLVRVLLFVGALAAVAAAILGIFVLQRHTGARIGVSVLAAPILVTAPFAGGFWGTLVVCAAILLWTRPARDWFAGRAPSAPARPREEPPAAAPPVWGQPDWQAPGQPGPGVPPGSDPVSGQPGPGVPPNPGQSGSGMPPAADRPEPAPGQQGPWAVPLPVTGPGAHQPPPTHQWGQPAPPPAPWQQRPVGRPPQLLVACIVAAVVTGITAMFLLAVLAFLAIDSDALVRAVRESPEWNEAYDDRLVVPAMVVGGLVLLGWCLATLVLILFAWRRHQWAWALLIASAGLATVVSLFAFPVGLLNVATAGVTVVLLLSLPVRAWFRGPRQGPPMPPPQQQPPPPPPSGQPPVW